MRMLWSEIRSIINIKNKNMFNTAHIVYKGKVVQDPKQIAKIFDNFFINIADKFIQIFQVQESLHLTTMAVNLSTHFLLSPTDSAEIECIISQLKNGKAAGPYSIPCNLLKMLNLSISLMLAILVNESFQMGVSPDKL